jgi:hypothetical protein
VLTLAVDGVGEMISCQREEAWHPWVRKLDMLESQSVCIDEEIILYPY